MTLSLKTSFNWHIQDLSEQFGQLLLANFILSCGKMMVAHLLYEPKNAWTDSHLLHLIDSFRCKNQRKVHRRSSILCIAVFQQGGFAAKEQPINSLCMV